MKNKHIPVEYRDLMSEVLKAYPELATTRIDMVLKRKHVVPYGTSPAIKSIFGSRKNRVYCMYILEQAKPPVQPVLFKNLTKSARKGVLAHELYHVVQYESCTGWQLIKFMISYFLPKGERKIERAADVGAINRGFGEELYEHAVYIRSIPGYVESRPAINKNYLKPEEIRKHINETTPSNGPAGKQAN